MKVRNITLIAALTTALAAGISGAYAYYSAKTDTVTNTYNIVAGGGSNGETVGKVEEIFNPEDAKDLTPRSNFTKDVKITSKLDYNSYAYLLVSVPNINARLKNESAKSLRESVNLNFDTAKWSLVKKTDGSDTAPAKYLYRCNSELAAKSSTPSLFTTVSVPDYAESDGISGSIDVVGYMISSVGVNKDDADQDAIAKFFS